MDECDCQLQEQAQAKRAAERTDEYDHQLQKNREQAQAKRAVETTDECDLQLKKNRE